MRTCVPARGLLAVGVCLAACGLTLAAQEKKSGGVQPVAEGKPAPDVDLPATTVEKGKTLKLKDYQGKKNVVLYFFPKAATRG